MNYEGKFPVTVADLIEELQKLKPDAIVYIQDHETGNLYDLSAVVSGGQTVELRFNDDDD
ncbi:hypothetical protein ACX27_04200 [Nostoc piscinale CENA21]|uniref:Uncharacterized protein n=1 Tax=Nostoc piscinale CENA21 TaxID=224013 RepID=A0A0M3V4J0_9NOSO|nr:hypothetical protein [Nostoc piscinale]ALF52233.1 hypothetical protein ACX27_04200 [Nostoc piscinale CENA21]